ncbi:MAG: DUF4864 domain-containing protein [Chthoniobacterales bacterium]
MNKLSKAALLLFLFLLCASAALITNRPSEGTAPPQPRELYSVVENQLAAIRAADFSSAYRHAASGVQQKLSRAQFEQMVRRDYVDMMRAGRVEFGSVKVQGATAIMQVFFFGNGGDARTCLYSLVSEDACWRIDGVEVIRGVPSRTRGIGRLHA